MGDEKERKDSDSEVLDRWNLKHPGQPSNSSPPTDFVIDVAVPEIVNRAPCAAHHHRPRTEEEQLVDRRRHWKGGGVGSHRDRPRCIAMGERASQYHHVRVDGQWRQGKAEDVTHHQRLRQTHRMASTTASFLSVYRALQGQSTASSI